MSGNAKTCCLAGNCDMKIPPYSVEAELGLICGLLHSPDDVAKLADLPVQAFYEAKHQVLFSQLLTLSGRCAPISLASLREAMVTDGQMDIIGGDAGLKSIGGDSNRFPPVFLILVLG